MGEFLNSNLLRMVEVVLLLATFVGVVISVYKFVKTYTQMKKDNIRIKELNKDLLTKIENKGNKYYAILNSRLKINEIIDKVRKAINAEGATVYIEYPSDPEWLIILSLLSKREMNISISSMPFRKESSSAGQCFKHGEFRIKDTLDNTLTQNPFAEEKTGIQTKRILEFPIKSNNKVIGVLQLLNKVDRFTDEDVQVIKNTFYESLQKELVQFLSIDNYLQGLDIHDAISRTSRTIVAMDLSNSQSVFNMTNNDIIAIMIIKEYYTLVSDIIHEYGGHIENFMGDGILVSFKSNKNSPVSKAVECSMNIYKEFDRMKSVWAKSFEEEKIKQIHLRQAMTFGEVNLIDIGEGFNSKYTLIGKTVNVAFNYCNALTRNKSVVVIDEVVKNKIQGKYKTKKIDVTYQKQGEKRESSVYEIEIKLNGTN